MHANVGALTPNLLTLAKATCPRGHIISGITAKASCAALCGAVNAAAQRRAAPLGDALLELKDLEDDLGDGFGTAPLLPEAPVRGRGALTSSPRVWRCVGFGVDGEACDQEAPGYTNCRPDEVPNPLAFPGTDDRRGLVPVPAAASGAPTNEPEALARN